VALFGLASVKGALLHMATLVLIIIESYGYGTFWNIQINSVQLVNLCVAVALGVQLTAHTAREWMTATGTRQQRTTTAINEMFVPMGNAAITAFLANAVLGAAKYPYFSIYFFDAYILILIFGFFNGILTMPILLSWLGPNYSLTSDDRQKRRNAAAAEVNSVEMASVAKP